MCLLKAIYRYVCEMFTSFFNSRVQGQFQVSEETLTKPVQKPNCCVFFYLN